MTLEPGGSIDNRTKSSASSIKHEKNIVSWEKFALSVAGDGSAIFGVELESIDQHLTFVKSIADVEKGFWKQCKCIQFVPSLSQIQRRTSEIANALFYPREDSSIDANKIVTMWHLV